MTDAEQPVEVPESAPPRVDTKPVEASPEAAPEEVNPQESTPVAAKKSPRNVRELKSNKPDLKIIVGADAGKEEERWYQSATMAEHSIYIDEQIDNMDKDSKQFEIRFDDITADTWDLMMKFLDPVESRDMVAKDVLIVSEFYDRYDFPLGRRLCDKVLQEHFLSEQKNEERMDVEMLVDAVAVSYKAHLTGAYEIGNQFVKAKLMSYKDKTYNFTELQSIPESTASAPVQPGSPSKNRVLSFGRRGGPKEPVHA